MRQPQEAWLLFASSNHSVYPASRRNLGPNV
jgi:hypothetical protein